jgi:single-strand DNA-binding protein
LNKIILVGNLTKDPELSTTNNGISLCKFAIAVQRRFPNADGNREADFFNIIVWRQQAENCYKFLKKGNKAGIVGALQIRTYDDENGNKRYMTEIIADEVEFLTPKGSAGGGGEEYLPPDNDSPAPARPRKPAELKPIVDDDLPF